MNINTSASLKQVAEYIANPVKDDINSDVYARMVSSIHFSFEQMRTKVIPYVAIETIATTTLKPVRSDIDTKSYDIVVKRLINAITGYTASDRH